MEVLCASRSTATILQILGGSAPFQNLGAVTPSLTAPPPVQATTLRHQFRCLSVRRTNVSSNKETVLAPTLTQLLLMLTSLAAGSVPVLSEGLVDVDTDSPPAVLVPRTRGVTGRWWHALLSTEDVCNVQFHGAILRQRDTVIFICHHSTSESLHDILHDTDCF